MKGQGARGTHRKHASVHAASGWPGMTSSLPKSLSPLCHQMAEVAFAAAESAFLTAPSVTRSRIHLEGTPKSSSFEPRSPWPLSPVSLAGRRRDNTFRLRAFMRREPTHRSGAGPGTYPARQPVAFVQDLARPRATRPPSPSPRPPAGRTLCRSRPSVPQLPQTDSPPSGLGLRTRNRLIRPAPAPRKAAGSPGSCRRRSSCPQPRPRVLTALRAPPSSPR